MIPSNRIATHPGVILLKEFLEPLGLAPEALATHIDLPIGNVSDLVKGEHDISPEMAWLLSEALETTPEFWVNLQSIYALSMSRPSRHVQPLVSIMS
ncbi:MAG: HigA family addiction module antitoxin [Cyanobacteria bacterium P01_D01_bin.36]